MVNNYRRPNKEDLENHFKEKYGNPDLVGWSPQRRFRMGYTLAGDIYEATIKNLVNNDTIWLDVGGGRALFPNNKVLSESLSGRCKRLVAVDPSSNVNENPFCHESVQTNIEEYLTKDKFDLITFRMVAEHIKEPDEVVKKIRDLLLPGGILVIYTINKLSPIPIFTRITPLSLHYKIKKFVWGGEARDTFPVQYKMNSRSQLASLFSEGFFVVDFRLLDDVSATIHFKFLNFIEMWAWKFFKVFNVNYPENNILAVYEKE